MPVEPIATEHGMQLEPQPLALDIPKTALNDAPLPEFVEPSELTPDDVPHRAEPVDIPGGVAQADLPELLFTEIPAEMPRETAGPQLPPNHPAAETVAAIEQLPTDSAEQTADASKTDNEEVETPVEDDATDTPALVYDEDAVDQRITFEKRVRPRPSMVSRRMGESGIILILVEVDAQGELIHHEVLDDAGFPRLLAAAVKAMKDSTFEPAIRGEQAVRSTRVIEYRF